MRTATATTRTASRILRLTCSTARCAPASPQCATLSLIHILTFYAQFSLNPKGQYPIAVCMGTACYVKGSQAILERLERKLGIEVGGVTPDGRFSLEATRCIGACGLAPVFTIGDDVYGKLTPEEAEAVRCV